MFKVIENPRNIQMKILCFTDFKMHIIFTLVNSEITKRFMTCLGNALDVVATKWCKLLSILGGMVGP